MKTDTVKTSITALMAALLATLGEIAAPFAILCIMMAADYCTGLMKAWKNGNVSSSVGIKGILKKLGYTMGIIAALGIDYVIDYTAKLSSATESYPPIFALAVIVWMTVNESISILENLVNLGVPLPAFLMKAARRLKQSVENAADKEDTDETP